MIRFGGQPTLPWRRVASTARTISAPQPSASHLRPGERVTHRAFGPGVAGAVKPSGCGDSEITVASDTSGIKKLLSSLAPLERG